MACAKLSTRIVCILDTYSNNDLILPNGDILIHAGDLTRSGQYDELKQVFNVKCDSEEIRSIWDKILLETDVLITNGPPYGILDSTSRKEHVNCKALYERIQIIKPKLHVFGHIHDSTIFVNAATCDIRYHPIQAPIIIEL